MACVAWTAFELFRLARGDVRPAFATLGDEPIAEPTPRSPRPRRRNFAAWDDRGRPVEVEDLGHP